MEPQRLAGLALVVAGVSGYVVGVYVSYPGRSFSITAVMLGVALAATASSPTEGPT
ncbi:hypothetical protein [Halovenus carboxidivorans]|uniref:hypothetical protein n=1 Tax=Halovenus carboxidivorans TaxID=2692199 RepID=UPI0019169567|nr:hypothetical protein [Halovenus carboxidivorans]